MRPKRTAPPSAPVTPRVRPRGMDEADWVDVLGSVPVDDELASIYDPALPPADSRMKDLEDYIDRRGLELDPE
jgi:hypothetical protein